LRISEYTVDEHLAALRRVFNVTNNPGLVRAAIEHGFILPFTLSPPKQLP
jgi:DNA-binding CsgD family transcriptional regulator